MDPARRTERTEDINGSRMEQERGGVEEEMVEKMVEKVLMFVVKEPEEPTLPAVRRCESMNGRPCPSSEYQYSLA